jgi:hypothetical protein
MSRVRLLILSAAIAICLIQTAAATPGWAWMQFGVDDMNVDECADTAAAALKGEGFKLADQHKWAWGAIYSGETSIHFGWIGCFQRRGPMQVIINVSTDREAFDTDRQATHVSVVVRNKLAKYFTNGPKNVETLAVPANLGVDSAGVRSKMILDPDRRYRITVGGYVAFFPSSPGDTDALYCVDEVWAPYFSPLPNLCRPLLVNGKGLDKVAGRAGEIPYNPKHAYAVVATGIRGALTFKSFDTAPADNTGSWNVKIELLP